MEGEKTRECYLCKEEQPEALLCDHQSNWLRAVCKNCCGNLDCYREFHEAMIMRGIVAHLVNNLGWTIIKEDEQCSTPSGIG